MGDDIRNAYTARQVWVFEQGEKRLERKKKSRLDILREAGAKPCTCAPASQWYEAAEDVLSRNEISVHDFVTALPSAS